MTRTQINVPIALDKGTNKLVHVKDVPNGLACNCYCASCKTDLIAVNQEIKQKAHFRHDGNSNCAFNSNYESYIHWLAKEVIKAMDKITVPAIYLRTIPDSSSIHDKFVVKVKGIMKNEGLLNHFPDHHYYFENLCLQAKQEIQINSVTTEKHYTTEFGNIRVDIVVEVEGQELFIEPFFSNKIDLEKFSKIASLNKSTISVNLFSFVAEKGHFFTIEEFKYYIGKEVAGKSWIWIRDSKISKLIDDLAKKNFESAISLAKRTFEKNIEIEGQLRLLDDKIKELYLAKNELAKGHIEIGLHEIIRGVPDGN